MTKRKYTKDEILELLKRVALMLVANIGYALCFHLFFEDNKIAPGGLNGLGVIVTNFVNIPIGLFTLMCNIPIFVWGCFVKDRSYMVITIITGVVDSFFTQLFSFIPAVTDNLMLAAILGGIGYGICVVIMAKADCSGGSTDLLAKILVTKFRNVSLGTMYLILDGAIILLSAIAFKRLELGIYGAVVIITYSVVSDKIINGFNSASMFHIVTDKPDEIADEIMMKVDRGVTLQKGIGMWAGAERNILLTVVRAREVYRVKDIVKHIDPNAFVTVTGVNEVMSESFGGGIDYRKTKKK